MSTSVVLLTLVAFAAWLLLVMAGDIMSSSFWEILSADIMTIQKKKSKRSCGYGE
ncbi:MAG: hypothetical protein L0J40_04000 [Alkalibacterium sp.]|nr:hypothetical protein [Alkalibacterium sp.]